MLGASACESISNITQRFPGFPAKGEKVLADSLNLSTAFRMVRAHLPVTIVAFHSSRSCIPKVPQTPAERVLELQ
ncbi:hypothetical protein DV515_00013221 [Chloebia gouldiae]|uniref:Uncharacterized protein n=1 Tax=Chloebia gouldiae TaxID=44316 RepID=A0A3L8S1M4_CHLGU|nr:hypothetical protein DV515_00013221 [Chloebia gouldiae]